MWLYVLIGIGCVLGLFLIVAALQPAEFRIVRTAQVRGPADAVFNLINDLHAWESWSPWAKLDPGMKREYAGPPQGVGASHSWLGNKKVGEGRMTVTASEPFRLVRLKLEFIKPWTATNVAEFEIREECGQSQISWSMTGKNDFGGKVFGLLMNMDKMVGRDFEK